VDLMQIPFEQFRPCIFDLWDRRWFLLTSGDFASGKYNTMTVSWGSTGILWGKPVFQVVVRPQRYTRLFMEQYDTFTLSVLPEAYRSALNLLGSRSGRDGNKIAEAGLTPAASRIAASPTFAEAELVIECKKLYWADLDPTHFINPALDQNYPRKDYHRQYFGEVLAIYGTRNYMDQG
jgi:flavin reductase (DIM6/NTAB) family NADH-FMN oxidoreductase RutF